MGPGRSIAQLKSSELARRLAADWGFAGSDDPGLVAAAHDRGFGSFPEAVEATRPFFLRRHLFDRPAPPLVA